MPVPQPQAHTQPQACIFLLQLGGPKDIAAIESFLQNLFEDVLPLPGFIRRPLAGLIAKRRVPEVAPLYQEIGGGSPLLRNTEAQRDALIHRLGELGIVADVVIAMRYAPPRAAEALAQARTYGPNVPWIVLPLYPQYSFATTRSSLDEMQAQLTAEEKQRLRIVRPYFDDPLYLNSVASRIQERLAPLDAAARRQTHLLFSAHGLPMKLIREGDPYPQQVEATMRGTLARVPDAPPASLSFQSRVGPVKWLEPSTIAALHKLGHEGCRRVMVVPISFVSEHIETMHELDIQLKEEAEKAGITDYIRVPTVACHEQFIDALAQQVMRSLGSVSDGR